jgi:secondary thiamine-phosphate synthase enzyme
MPVVTTRIRLSTQAEFDICDITRQVADAVRESGLDTGAATVFVPGATGALTTMEFEPGLVADMRRAFEQIAPAGLTYEHNRRWHDENGHSHVRASLVGPSVAVPFEKRTLLLGPWQQIVFLDFDVRARERELVVQIIGE